MEKEYVYLVQYKNSVSQDDDGNYIPDTTHVCRTEEAALQIVRDWNKQFSEGVPLTAEGDVDPNWDEDIEDEDEEDVQFYYKTIYKMELQ